MQPKGAETMKKYYHIQSNNWCDFGITTSPKLGGELSFLAGRKVDKELLPPLRFSMDFPVGEHLPHIIGDVIPLCSPKFIEMLVGLGIDNYQLFPSVIVNPETKNIIRNYKVWNVLGLVPAADMDKSSYDTIMKGDSDGVVPPLVMFDELVLKRDVIFELDLFRLAEQPSVVVASERIFNALVANRPNDGWGIDAIEIAVT